MLWLWLLSLWSSLVLFLTRRRLRIVAPYATAVLLGFAVFFAGLLVFLETPFGLSQGFVAEGSGLNPLLRHPSMMIHPPMLYSGYTLFAIPFAFAVGALVTRQVGAADWIRSTRRFALAAWFFLGIGILLGARWSYTELGWGGYWAWDPVENASLLPWLTGTAFLHSIMLQEKRGMLKIWNVSLVLATGVLAIMGTFLVRSGILDSIHAFGASTLGVPFVILIGAMIAGSIGLVVWRRQRAALGEPAGLDALARGGLPRQQPRARRDGVRRLLGHVLAADRRGAHRHAALARPAVVRPLHRAAGARARAAQRDRAGHRLAPRDGRQRAPQLRRARRGGARDRRRAVRVPRRRLAPARARDVHGRRVRLRDRRPGVLARRRGAPDDDGGGAAAGAALARRAQPPPLRRLHRPRRHGGAVHRRRGLDGLQRRPRHPPRRRPDGARRRLRLPLPQADVADLDDELGRAGEDLLRRGRRRQPRRADRDDAAARARLLPVARRQRPRAGRALLRGRGDERGRSAGRAAPRHLDGDDARHPRAAADHPRRRQGLRAMPPASSRPRPRRRRSARRCAASPTATHRTRRPRRSGSSPHRS